MFYTFLTASALLAQIFGSYIGVPADLSLSHTTGDVASTQVLKVTNVGSQAALFAATGDQSWLSVFLGEPSITEALLRNGLDLDFTVRADPTGLKEGVYHGAITLRAQDIGTGAAYDTQNVTVVLTVREGIPAVSGEASPEPTPTASSFPTASPAPTPKIQESATVKVPGSAKTTDGTPAEAFIWAWSDKGKTNSLQSARNGSFEMELDRNDRWHLGASAEINNLLQRSSEVTINTASAPALPVELVLSAFGVQPLPEAVRITRSAEERIEVKVSDGAGISIPPLAARQEGAVSVEVKPVAESLSQKGTRVISTVYDITLKDKGGQDIKTFDQDVEVTLPYREQDLQAQGTNESRIVPAYFDVSKHTWVRIASFRVDKEKKVIRFFTRHLTRFALVAPADTQPPDAPTNVRVTENAPGFRIEWINPTYDFHHAKIYRSRAQGAVGKLVLGNVVQASRTDDFKKEVGAAYYYLVRIVDLAGNESLNSKQIAVRATNVSIQASPEPEVVPSPTTSSFVASPSVTASSEPVMVSSTPTPAPTQEPQGFFPRFKRAVAGFFQRIFGTSKNPR
ncbi:MAG: hypothetical protein Q7S09_03780 [bacterium]|nr:hypothetical protein [bacterium]